MNPTFLSTIAFSTSFVIVGWKVTPVTLELSVPVPCDPVRSAHITREGLSVDPIGDGTGLDNPAASSRLTHLKCAFTERVFHEDCDELRLTFLPQTTQDDFDGTV